MSTSLLDLMQIAKKEIEKYSDIDTDNKIEPDEKTDNFEDIKFKLDNTYKEYKELGFFEGLFKKGLIILKFKQLYIPNFHLIFKDKGLTKINSHNSILNRIKSSKALPSGDFNQPIKIEDHIGGHNDGIHWEYCETKLENISKNSNSSNSSRKAKFQTLIFKDVFKTNNSFHIIKQNSIFYTSVKLKIKDRQDVIGKKVGAVIEKIVIKVFSTLYIPIKKLLKKEFEIAKIESPDNVFTTEDDDGNKTVAFNFNKNIIIGYIAYSFFLFLSIVIFINILDSYNLLDFLVILQMLPIVGIIAFLVYSRMTISESDVKHKKIQVDNKIFNEEFEIHTENDISSYNFLQSENIEIINGITENISFESIGNDLLIFIHNKENLFEFSKKDKKLEDLFSRHLLELQILLELPKKYNFFK